MLSQVPKFIFPAFGLAGFLPKFIRSRFNFFFGRFGHCSSPIGVSGAAEGGGLTTQRRPPAGRCVRADQAKMIEAEVGPSTGVVGVGSRRPQPTAMDHLLSRPTQFNG
jgi:hypothetical protein